MDPWRRVVAGATCGLVCGVRSLICLMSLTSCAARKFNVPIYSLLGGKVRDKVQVYAWIGGDRPSDVEVQAYVHPHAKSICI